MTDLRTRIISALLSEDDVALMADAVIRELDDVLVDFGLWLSEEITGKPISRIDLESCHQEWKWLNDESRWIKGGTDAD